LVSSLFQGCGLSPKFFSAGIIGLLRRLRSESALLPSCSVSGVSVIPTTSAYLDDITTVIPLESMFDVLDKLREIAPDYGLSFDNMLKNSFYVPQRFRDCLNNLISKTSDRRVHIIDDESAGAFKRSQLKLQDADRTGVHFAKPSVLVSIVGVERLLGSPFRVVDSNTSSTDMAWIKARVTELAQPALQIFAHLGLESVDMLGRKLTSKPEAYNTNVPKIHEPQLQSLVTSYCFAPKLFHLARVLLPEVVSQELAKVEQMQVEVYNALSDGRMTKLMQQRAILPRRYGGIVPGISPVAPAAFVASNVLFESFIFKFVNRVLWTEDDSALSFGVRLLFDRIADRKDLASSNGLTTYEAHLRQACNQINNAATQHPILASRKVHVGAKSGTTAMSGDTTSVEAPAPFSDLLNSKANQRSLSDFLWIRHFNLIYSRADNRDRLLMDEGATSGSGLFLQGIPSSPHFRFSPQVMMMQIRSYLGIAPSPSMPWPHSCSKGDIRCLRDNNQCSHLFYCNQQGRSIAVHGVVLEQLREMLLAAKYGYGWLIERTLENPNAPLAHQRWRADLVGYDPKGKCILIDVGITSMMGDSVLRSRSAEALGRTAAILRDKELTKERNPRVQASLAAHNAAFIPFVLSGNGALGSQAMGFLKRVFAFVKTNGLFSMRSCFDSSESTWSTTWFSTYWLQRISSATTATNAFFVDRIIRADVAATHQQGRSAYDRRYPQFYHYDPNQRRRGIYYSRNFHGANASHKAAGS
jgi:hypothetical protein